MSKSSDRWGADPIVADVTSIVSLLMYHLVESEAMHGIIPVRGSTLMLYGPLNCGFLLMKTIKVYGSGLKLHSIATR